MEIKWGTQQPAPDSILEYALCSTSVRRDVKQKDAFAKRQISSVLCTELCQCTNCENSESSEMEGDETALDFADGAFVHGDARDCSEELFQ